jgi:cation transport ATPase
MPEEDHDPRHSPLDGSGSTEDRQFNVAAMMVGTAMMFVGFLNVLLSISGGFEFAGVTPMLLYFAGMAIWGHAVIRNPTIRYAVIMASVALALAFFHYGEVLFWHKQVVFWGTVVLVAFFMFKTSEPTRR